MVEIGPTSGDVALVSSFEHSIEARSFFVRPTVSWVSSTDVGSYPLLPHPWSVRVSTSTYACCFRLSFFVTFAPMLALMDRCSCLTYRADVGFAFSSGGCLPSTWTPSTYAYSALILFMNFSNVGSSHAFTLGFDRLSAN